ncbi:hypothetical protein DINM_004192 [Dirofilaria immitis]|nr:hypothetical protein [Dirofilaria immitis]
MIIILTFSLLHASLLWNVVSSLECYTGFSVIRGQTVGTTKEVCSKQSDSCYRAMANVNLLNRNKCIEQELFGSKTMFCCCDDRDLCNAASTSFAIIISIATILNNPEIGKSSSSIDKTL